MLRHEPGGMDLAEGPWWWMLRHESDTWIRSSKHFSRCCDCAHTFILNSAASALYQKGAFCCCASFFDLSLYTVWGRLPVYCFFLWALSLSLENHESMIQNPDCNRGVGNGPQVTKLTSLAASENKHGQDLPFLSHGILLDERQG